MTITGQYLTWEDYKTLGNSEIGEMPFKLLEFEVRKRIDLRTSNRLKDLEYEEIPQEVKLCENEMINSLRTLANAKSKASENGNIVSENTDGYSVTYLTADKISELATEKDKELTSIIRNYLLNVEVNDVNIMYCGF